MRRGSKRSETHYGLMGGRTPAQKTAIWSAMHRRPSRGAPRHTLAVSEAVHDDPSAKMQQAEDLAGLHSALRTRLSERDYEIVMLRASGMKYQQIGEVYGVCKQRIHQVIERAARLCWDLA